MKDHFFASKRDEALNIHFSPHGDPVIDVYKKDVDIGALRRNLSLTVEERMNNFLRGMEAMYEFRRAGDKLRA
ncbi:MAG: hypothetical protein ACKVP0_20200 [Pirellulaceae bacterium]